MAKMQGIAGRVTPGLYQKGFRELDQEVLQEEASGGYIAEEARDVYHEVLVALHSWGKSCFNS